jgi:hypothetical protein
MSSCSCVDLTTCAEKRKLHRDTLERFRNLVASGLWPVPTSYFVFKSYRDGPQGRGYSRRSLFNPTWSGLLPLRDLLVNRGIFHHAEHQSFAANHERFVGVPRSRGQSGTV